MCGDGERERERERAGGRGVGSDRGGEFAQSEDNELECDGYVT
jgi:hypothetical protein